MIGRVFVWILNVNCLIVYTCVTNLNGYGGCDLNWIHTCIVKLGDVFCRNVLKHLKHLYYNKIYTY